MPADSEAYPALTLAELADPERAISAAIELYGDQAKTALACCALEAHFAGRKADYRFWCGVFKKLDAGKMEARH
ncbi:hypothetical protein [Mesorhizobium kowhaii]|uniref:Uncharacterized protein n=1 Tax=Mesorhizobium kowhaii TaxID=1300272 RepID=A0A2W7CKV0_9HYPH|nr:hypothetical protein [Mesorhizobium kowhaii]PZV34389.1 hypothetical protein B5V02_33155 [Mesorhizobium kowhaii]